MMILVGAMCLGFVQILTGMAISFYKKLRDGQVMDAVWEEVTWWVVFAGAALAILGVTNLVLILGNAWLPLAAALLMIYQPMERALGLEEQIRAAQASRRAKVAPAAPSQAAASKSSPSRRLAPNQNRSTIQG